MKQEPMVNEDAETLRLLRTGRVLTENVKNAWIEIFPHLNTEEKQRLLTVLRMEPRETRKTAAG